MRLPRLHLTFIARFTIMTAVLALVTAWVVPTALVRAHVKAVADDEAATAAGQVSALLGAPLEAYLNAVPASRPGARIAVQQAIAAGLRIPVVSAIAVYAPDGRAIFPSQAPPANAGTAAAIAAEGLYSTASTAPDGSAGRTVYAPFSGRGRIRAVVAVTMPVASLEERADAERTLIVTIVLTAMAVIFVALFALALGASRELERRRREAETTFAQTLASLAESLDLRDPYTAGHSARVAEYSTELARALRLPRRDVEIVTKAAQLHDLGKIAVPDAVLLKAGALDARERWAIHQHPSVGAKILRGIASMEDVVPCVLHHHERIDGSGYPDRLASDAIPLGARILAVADTFDAMTTDRPYRRALGAEVALAEMRRVAGAQLDARMVETFASLVRAGRIIPPAPARNDDELVDRFGPRLGHAGGAAAG